jgi:hypothetical protein
MKKNLFFTGILIMPPIFGMTVAGCDGDDGGRGGGCGASANPLAGAWYKGGALTNPHELIVFSGGRFYGLYGSGGLAERNEAVAAEAYIKGTAYICNLSSTGRDTLIVNGYNASRNPAANVEFARIEGSTKTGGEDVRYAASLSSTGQNRTALVITSSGVTFRMRKQYGGVDAGRSRIDRQDGTTTPYALGGTSLGITQEQITNTNLSQGFSGTYTQTAL